MTSEEKSGPRDSKTGLTYLTQSRKALTLAWEVCYLYRHAEVAQSVEQRPEKPRVGGSIPPLGTIPTSPIHSLLLESQ